MNRPEIGHDAWTYHQFGARSFEDQIRAFVIDQLDQSSDRLTVRAQLRQQSAGSAFPIIAIPRAKNQLLPEPVDSERIGGVASFVGQVKLQEYPISVRDTAEDAEALAKIVDRLGRRVALDLAFAFLHGRSMHSVFPTLTEMTQAIEALGPDR